MVKLHPEILKKNGKKEFVVLPYEEFEALQELLDDAQDVLALREAKAEDAGHPGVSMEDVKRRFGIGA